jgi:hypothetical protein
MDNLERVRKYPVVAEDRTVFVEDQTKGGVIVAGGDVVFRANRVSGKTLKSDVLIQVPWQDGVVDPAVGANGMTVEALQQAIISRLEAFQATKFACEENVEALRNAKQALHWMNARREERFNRDVLNTHTV